LANRIAGVADGEPAAIIALGSSSGDLSWADVAAVARAHAEIGQYEAAAFAVKRLDTVAPDAAGSEAVLAMARTYLEGVFALGAGDADGSARAFDAAYAVTPGEAASALAYAAALEAGGERSRFDEAAALYEQVAIADPSWVAAIAGLARILVMLDRPIDAARVLVAVPDSHPSRAEALTLACRLMERGPYDEVVAVAAGDHVRAGRPGARAPAEAELAASLFRAALAALGRGETVGATVGGCDGKRRELARAAERALLDLADATPNPTRRHELLDEAARTRPWSLL
jgi:tetratricopeptide (TPR) repeat protein